MPPSPTSSPPQQAPLPKGRRITGAERDQLAAQVCERYLSGHSVRQLADGLGRSYGFVHRLLADSGIALRGRGGDTRSRDTAPGD